MYTSPRQATEHARWVFQDGGGMSPASDAWGYGEAAGGGAGRKSPSSAMNTPTTQACTLCVVRPHVVRDGGLGEVLSFVAERGFQVGVGGGGGGEGGGGGGGGGRRGGGGAAKVGRQKWRCGVSNWMELVLGISGGTPFRNYMPCFWRKSTLNLELTFFSAVFFPLAFLFVLSYRCAGYRYPSSHGKHANININAHCRAASIV